MFNAANINAVVFDLDDTLRYNDPHAHGFFCDFAETLSHPLDAETRRNAQLWEHRYWATSDDLTNDLRAYGEGHDNFWHNYTLRHLQVLGFTVAEATKHAPAVHAHMRENYKPQNRIIPGTHEALQELKTAGYLLGVITNRPKPIHAEIHTLGLDTVLDFYLTAGQLGAFKPHRQIFDNVLKFISGLAEQLLYVGDNYYADVLGARNAGIQAVLLNWHGLYTDLDCPEIKRLSELSALLQLQTA